jgi:hypothetical protein
MFCTVLTVLFILLKVQLLLGPTGLNRFDWSGSDFLPSLVSTMTYKTDIENLIGTIT